MSKTTNKMSAILFEAYFNQLAINNRWLDLWPKNEPSEPKRSISAIDIYGGITIYGATYSGKVSKPSPKMFICIKLFPHLTKNVFLVERFEVFPARINISSITQMQFLQHYNKRCATFEDSKKDDISDFWTISCPKDLESFLRAYDSLMKFYGHQTVFNIP